jgi:16S rRNA (uracil1498-N3)-methyltransferase
VPVAARQVILLSGPEGGLTPAEEDSARAVGFVTTSMGPRTLRADTAPLAALAAVALGG